MTNEVSIYAIKKNAPKIWNSLPPHILQSQTYCCLVAALEHENGQSKLDPFWDSQPVKFLKQRSNAVVLATAVDQSRCGVEHCCALTVDGPAVVLGCQLERYFRNQVAIGPVMKPKTVELVD